MPLFTAGVDMATDVGRKNWSSKKTLRDKSEYVESLTSLPTPFWLVCYCVRLRNMKL